MNLLETNADIILGCSEGRGTVETEERSKNPNKTSHGIQSIGIPRALLFHRYGVLWTTFLENLGFDVVLSPPTDRALVETGDAFSVDECCLASKAFLGHVDYLRHRCDALFVPSFGNGNPRAGFCTKFQAQQDLVRNTFREEGPQLLTLRIEDITDAKAVRQAYIDFACFALGASPKDATRAWKKAQSAAHRDDSRKAAAQRHTLRLLDEYRRVVATDTSGSEQQPLAVLLVAHPYIAHDDYLAGAIIDVLHELDVTVIFADETARDRTFKESFDFSATIPWIINRELIGSILQLQDSVDGIVLVSAFPCGPDSMTDDAIMRTVQGTPILNLMIDAQSGTAGVETRVESFVDILRFQNLGGYGHE